VVRDGDSSKLAANAVNPSGTQMLDNDTATATDLKQGPSVHRRSLKGTGNDCIACDVPEIAFDPEGIGLIILIELKCRHEAKLRSIRGILQMPAIYHKSSSGYGRKLSGVKNLPLERRSPSAATITPPGRPAAGIPFWAKESLGALGDVRSRI
jgi:hypothetical protein